MQIKRTICSLSIRQSHKPKVVYSPKASLLDWFLVIYHADDKFLIITIYKNVAQISSEAVVQSFLSCISVIRSD